MFGHNKTRADALVVAAESVKISLGSNLHDHETWKYVLEVQPDGAPAYRALIETKIATFSYRSPAVGETVRVEFDADHPDDVEVILDGDAQYDKKLANKLGKAAQKNAAPTPDPLLAALNEPPGTPIAAEDSEPG
jgi:hypothetical protein